jgi:hypothetical protein
VLKGTELTQLGNHVLRKERRGNDLRRGADLEIRQHIGRAIVLNSSV